MKCLVAVGEGEVKSSFFTEKVINELEKLGEIKYNTTGNANFTKSELIENIKDVDVIFTGWGTPRLDKDVMAAAKQLKIHAHTGGSVASYISAEEYKQGVQVLSGNDLFAKSVAEGCLCYTLTCLRRTEEYIKTVRDGGWQPSVHQTQGLIGKKIGLIGFGAIAKHYVKLLEWFSPELYICSEYITEEEIKRYNAKSVRAEEIFETCDIISFHAALNEKTKGMYTSAQLQKIKNGALFVNTARAGIFNENDLYQELKKNRFHAVLDVYHEEPLPENNILRKLPNVTMFPHVAGPTFDMREKVVLKLIEDVQALQQGITDVSSKIPYDYAIRMTIN